MALHYFNALLFAQFLPLLLNAHRVRVEQLAIHKPFQNLAVVPSNAAISPSKPSRTSKQAISNAHFKQAALREALDASARAPEPAARRLKEQASSDANSEQTSLHEDWEGPAHQLGELTILTATLEQSVLRETLHASDRARKPAVHQVIEQSSSNASTEHLSPEHEVLQAAATVHEPAVVKQHSSNASFFELLASAKSWASAKSDVVVARDGIDKVSNVFSILAIAYFLFLIIMQNPELEEKLHEVDEERGKLLGNYNNTVEDMSSKLKHLMDVQMGWTEHALNGQRKDFAKFLKYVNDQRDFFGAPTPELLKRFRGFVASWLIVYRECSRKPVDEPKVIVSEKELNQCKSVSEVAELVGHRLSAEKIEFLSIGNSSDGGWSNPFSQATRSRRDRSLDDDEIPEVGNTCSWLNCCGLNRNFIYVEEPDEDGWPFTLGMRCCGITLLTPMHLFIVLSFIFGLGLLTVDVVLHRLPSLLLLLTGEVALFVVLLRFEQIDDLARLEAECGKLQDLGASIEKQHADLVEFYDALEDSADLWYFRTIPCLCLLKEMAMKLEDECQGNAELAVQLCDVAEKGMAIIHQCAGPLEFWSRHDCGKGLKILKRGIENCAAFVQEKDVPTIAKELDIWNVVLVVRVRFHAVNSLSRWRPLTMIDPYVRARIGKAQWVRTRTINNERNPRWSDKEDKDFQFKALSTEEKLEVQVMHDQPMDIVLEDDLVCMAAIDWSTVAPGSWQSIKAPLLTAAGGRAGSGQRLGLWEVTEEKQSSIELSVFVCRSLEQIDQLPGFSEQRRGTEVHQPSR